MATERKLRIGKPNLKAPFHIFDLSNKSNPKK
jgi:hypothetical protein